MGRRDLSLSLDRLAGLIPQDGGSDSSKARCCQLLALCSDLIHAGQLPCSGGTPLHRIFMWCHLPKYNTDLCATIYSPNAFGSE